MVDLEKYDYSLPDGLIATEPADPRDSSRLFVYDTKTDTISLDTFKNLQRYVPSRSILVFNDTKVVPARLFLKKETGGKIEVLLAVNELREGDDHIKGVTDRKIEIGAKLYFEGGEYLTVIRQEEQFFFFSLSVPIRELAMLLEREGKTPIPPYIKNSPLSENELRIKYQSLLAKAGASIAAPTASLHFTDAVLSSLQENGVTKQVVTLHVGAGTFAPLREENFKDHALFTEYCSISEGTASAIHGGIEKNVPIIPVGSTAMRTLESFASKGRLECGEKGTDIFIYPPHRFQIASGLITNFHVPKSSLMLMVDAFLEHKKAQRRIMDLYRIAIDEKFRFYSFGDAMLIL